MNETKEDRRLTPFSLLRNDMGFFRDSLFPEEKFEVGNFMASVWQPRTDISETKKEFVVRTDLPGVQRDDIEVTVVDDALVIRGKRSENKREEKENVIRVERAYGSFYRRIPLSEHVLDENVKAEFKDGELVVRIPKAEESKPKRVKID